MLSGKSVKLLSTGLLMFCCMGHLGGLVPDCNNSIANALELLQSCTKPLICFLKCVEVGGAVRFLVVGTFISVNNEDQQWWTLLNGGAMVDPAECPLIAKVYGASMGPIWGRQDPGEPHVGPINFAIWVWFLIHILSWLAVSSVRCRTSKNKTKQKKKQTIRQFTQWL